MKIIVSTFYYPNYKELVAKTIPNHRSYCEKYGYEYIPCLVDLSTEGKTPNDLLIAGGIDNITTILSILDKNPDCGAVFRIGSDAIITNMGLTLEGLLKFYQGFQIVCGTDKAGISASQMFVRNTDQAKKYLHEILNGIYRKRYEHDQDFIWKNPRDFIAGAPQRWLNAYDCESRLEYLDDPGELAARGLPGPPSWVDVGAEV